MQRIENRSVEENDKKTKKKNALCILRQGSISIRLWWYFSIKMKYNLIKFSRILWIEQLKNWKCSHIVKKGAPGLIEVCQRLVFIAMCRLWVLSNQLFSSVKMKQAIERSSSSSSRKKSTAWSIRKHYRIHSE